MYLMSILYNILSYDKYYINFMLIELLNKSKITIAIMLFFHNHADLLLMWYCLISKNAKNTIFQMQMLTSNRHVKDICVQRSPILYQGQSNDGYTCVTAGCKVCNTVLTESLWAPRCSETQDDDSHRVTHSAGTFRWILA